MSTVRGKKSAPSRTLRDAVAVTRTIVSPMVTVTAPSASPASLPASKDRVLSVPDTGRETEWLSAMVLLSSGAGLPAPTRWDSRRSAALGWRAAPGSPPEGDLLAPEAELRDELAVALDV